MLKSFTVGSEPQNDIFEFKMIFCNPLLFFSILKNGEFVLKISNGQLMTMYNFY